MEEDEIQKNQSAAENQQPKSNAVPPSEPATAKNQSSRKKPKKKGGPRPGAGRKKQESKPKVEAPAPVAPPVESKPESNGATDRTEQTDDPFGAPTASEADPHAELRAKIARRAPAIEPYTSGLIAPLLCGLAARETGVNLMDLQVRVSAVSRTGAVRYSTQRGDRALGVGLAQLFAGLVPELEGDFLKHPMAPCAVTLASCVGLFGVAVLAKQMGLSPEDLQRAAKEANEQANSAAGDPFAEGEGRGEPPPAPPSRPSPPPPAETPAEPPPQAPLVVRNAEGIEL